MDYNISIPNIYNYSDKKNDYRIELFEQEYKIKSNNFITFDIPENTLYMIFIFDNNNIFLDGNKIWNNYLYFKSKNICQNMLKNKSDTDVTININIIVSKEKLYLFRSRIDTYDNNNVDFISLLCNYSGIHFVDKMYIIVSNKIDDKIIKLQIFNIILFYKVKLLSRNNYAYELKLYHIKNIFTDDDIHINLDYRNIYDILKIYLETKKNIKIFMEKNIEYLINNKIEIPENIKDPDGWNEHMFYQLNPQNFIRKYNIITYYIYNIFN